MTKTELKEEIKRIEKERNKVEGCEFQSAQWQALSSYYTLRIAQALEISNAIELHKLHLRETGAEK